MKKNGESQRTAPRAQPEQKPRIDAVGLATLAGVVAVLMISFSNMRDIDRLDRTMGERLAKLETQVSQVGTRAQQPAQARQGPDPARVYSINTASSVTKGRAGAPITIAEFSDFQ